MTYSPFRPVQLLSAGGITDAPKYLNSDEWWLQEKKDGQRRQLFLSGEPAMMGNRDGVPRTPPVELQVRRPGALLLDGELIGTVYHAFDALWVDGQDLTDLPYSVRYGAAEQAVADLPTAKIVMVPLARTTAEKRNLWKLAMNGGLEGVVAKQVIAPYRSGRAASQVKLKFWNTVVVKVASVNEKRSVEMRTRDGIDVGTCPIPVTHAVPDPGALIDVKYLYAYPDTHHLAQPIYRGQRDDLDDADSVAELAFKAGV